MAKLRKAPTAKATKRALSNSGSTTTFKEHTNESPIGEKKLRGRSVAVTSKTIKKKTKKTKPNLKSLANRTYSLSPVKNDVEECTVLQTPMASSTFVVDNIKSPLYNSLSEVNGKSSIINISSNSIKKQPLKKNDLKEKLAFSSLIPVARFNLQKHVMNKNLNKNRINEENKLANNASKVKFGNIEMIPPNSSIGSVNDSTASTKLPLQEIATPNNVVKRKNFVYTPINEKKVVLNDSSNLKSNKSISYEKSSSMKSILSNDIRKKIRKSASTPSLSPKIKINSVKTLTKTNSVVFDSSTQKDAKPVSRIKMPNFTKIHQKNFGKMESVLDHAQRKVERAKYLMTPNKKAQGNTEGSKTISDFRDLKKNLIKDRHEKHVQMARKAPVKAESFSTRRHVLKGVRLNKRFDLQLKFRQEVYEINH